MISILGFCKFIVYPIPWKILCMYMKCKWKMKSRGFWALDEMKWKMKSRGFWALDEYTDTRWWPLDMLLACLTYCNIQSDVRACDPWLGTHLKRRSVNHKLKEKCKPQFKPHFCFIVLKDMFHKPTSQYWDNNKCYFNEVWILINISLLRSI